MRETRERGVGGGGGGGGVNRGRGGGGWKGKRGKRGGRGPRPFTGSTFSPKNLSEDLALYEDTRTENDLCERRCQKGRYSQLEQAFREAGRRFCGVSKEEERGRGEALRMGSGIFFGGGAKGRRICGRGCARELIRVEPPFVVKR